MSFVPYKKWSKENKFQDDITVLIPGSFKVMTGAHKDLILRYLNHPNVKEVKVLIGPGVRNGITQKDAIKVANILLKDIERISIESVIYPSPILTAYKYIETADPGTYAMGASEKDEGLRGYQRVLDFVKGYNVGGKYYSLKPENVNVIELNIDIKPLLYKGRNDEYENTPISASILRQDVLKTDYDNFKTNYPNENEETILSIWKIVKPIVVESLIFEKFVEDLLPDNLIDTFYKRVQKLLIDHPDKNHPLIKKELYRIKDLNGKIPQKIKELLNEKFVKDSDPIKDLGIGVFTKHNFNTEKEILDWIWSCLPTILGGEIPKNIIKSDYSEFFNRNVDEKLEAYLYKYIRLRNGRYSKSWNFNNALRNALLRKGYKLSSTQKWDPIFHKDRRNLKINESYKLFEGGNIFKNTGSILKENINPTINKFKSKLNKVFPKINFDFELLGSAGKKPISNDIDLALSEDLIFDKNENIKFSNWNIDPNEFEITYQQIRKRARTSSEKQSKLNAFIKLISNVLINDNEISVDSKGSGSGTLFCSFPQYDEKNQKIGKNVQIDINIGNLDWLKFSYHSETYESNVKGLHRTQLIVSLFKNKGRTFRHGTGVVNLQSGEYEATSPKEAIDLLNYLYDFKDNQLNANIIGNFFKLHEFLIKNLDKSELNNVYDIYLRILDSTRADIPEDIQYYWIKNKDRLGLKGNFLPEDSKLKRI